MVMISVVQLFHRVCVRTGGMSPISGGPRLVGDSEKDGQVGGYKGFCIVFM